MYRHHKPQEVCRPLNPILHANNTLFKTKMTKKPLPFEVTHTYIGEYPPDCTSRAHVSCVIRRDHVLLLSVLYHLHLQLQVDLLLQSPLSKILEVVRYQKTEPPTFFTSRGKFCPSKIMISPYKEFCFSQYPKGVNKRGIRVISRSAVHNQIRERKLNIIFSSDPVTSLAMISQLGKQSLVDITKLPCF